MQIAFSMTLTLSHKCAFLMNAKICDHLWENRPSPRIN